MRRVLTDDTRLARVELLGEVRHCGRCTRRRRLVIRIETRSTHTRCDNVVAAEASSTVTVVASQLIRGNAVVLCRVILVPHSVSQRVPQRRPGRCLLTRVLTLLVVQPCSVTERAAAAVDLCKGGVENCGFSQQCTKKMLAADMQKNTQLQAMTSPGLKRGDKQIETINYVTRAEETNE